MQRDSERISRLQHRRRMLVQYRSGIGLLAGKQHIGQNPKFASENGYGLPASGNRTGEAFMSQTDSWTGLNKIYDRLALDFMYSDPMAVLTFLDNHDTDRFFIGRAR